MEILTSMKRKQICFRPFFAELHFGIVPLACRDEEATEQVVNRVGHVERVRVLVPAPYLVVS